MIRCATLWRRVVPPVGGRWIAYSAAQVAARRAAQMVLVVTCNAVPTPAATPAPERPWTWEPVLLAPRAWLPAGDAVATPEPSAWALLLVALALLGVARCL